jgi:hypothetical protein
MPNLRQVVLNSNAGAFVDILAAGAPRSIEFMEDEAGTTQGIQVKTLEDAFATTNVLSFGSQPGEVPSNTRYPNRGPLLGLCAQGVVGAFNRINATKLISVRSNGASGTTLRFIENE